MIQPCRTCNSQFEITEEDSHFYALREVPPPTLCPRCRLQRRLAFRNERNLYKRKSDKSGKDMIGNVRPEASFPVYHIDEWHSDSWTAPSLVFDFNRDFFEQLKELWRFAPRMHKATAGSEVNSEYMNHAGNSKNCYYIFNSEYDEDCMYLRFADHCRDCVDSTNIMNSELCYECVNVEHCYNLRHSDDCKNCRDSSFLRFCRGVQNSIFCYGLDKKEYHMFNKPHSKEEYENHLRALKLDTWSGFEAALNKWNEWSAQFPRTREVLLNCENCTGDSLLNSKNAHDCYNCNRLEDCRYVLNSVDVKDTYDMYAYGEIEIGYELVTVFECYDVKFSNYSMKSDNLEYCDNVWNCHYCFGCIGLNGKSYCIFNKQYTKKEYLDMVPRIRQMMLQAGPGHTRYGEFFPQDFSMFPYEDTLAQDYFPREGGAPKLHEGEYKETASLPDSIGDANLTAIAGNVYKCPATGQPFRFQKQELEFYKKMALPIPRICFEARYARRNEFVPFPY